MKKKITLLLIAFMAVYAANAQDIRDGSDEPCNATLLTVFSTCTAVDTTQGAINTPTFTNSTNASSGVTLPALVCNGFTTTTRDFWYRCIVPASGSIVVDISFGADDINASAFWDMAVYRSSSATCAGSSFTLLGSECLAGNFPRLKFSSLTPGATIYIRLWRQAASVQTATRSFGIFVANGNIAQPTTCATLTEPINGVLLKDDPFVVWNISPTAQSYDVYYGKTSTIATMNVISDLQPATATQTQLGIELNHGDALATAPNNILIQPNAINYWFVHQKNCATDPLTVPSCSPATYTAAPVPLNDNCTGAILLNEDAVYKTHSSASSTESRVAATCSGSASTTASDVWFKFKTSNVASPSVTIGVATFFMDAVVEAFSGTCTALTSISCIDAVASDDEEVLVLSGLAPNTTYYIRVYNWNGDDYLYGEEFDIAVSGNLAIPVELVSFTGKTQGSNNALNWNTATERNAQTFIVERSADGENNFKAIGSVKAVGTSSTPQSYAFLDINPLPLSYYRLRQVDMDGKTELSKTVSIQRKDKRFALENAFPSPVSNDLTVQYSADKNGDISLQVIDIFGRIILTENALVTEGSHVSKLNLNNLAAGAYILQLSDGQKSAQMRIVKQ
jgi:Secretion system C-terminal sorting domain